MTADSKQEIVPENGAETVVASAIYEERENQIDATAALLRALQGLLALDGKTFSVGAIRDLGSPSEDAARGCKCADRTGI